MLTTAPDAKTSPSTLRKWTRVRWHSANSRLLRGEDGVYRGFADFIAPMPADGRDIIYRVDYALRRLEDGGFAGTQTITEGGGHSLPCPVEFAPGGVKVGEQVCKRSDRRASQRLAPTDVKLGLAGESAARH